MLNLSFTQGDINRKAWTIKCRITSENVSQNLPPLPWPDNQVASAARVPDLRIDEGIYQGYTVPFNYDLLICKLMMTWDKTWKEAIRAEMMIVGTETNPPSTVWR